jgi:hypothetical protein
MELITKKIINIIEEKEKHFTDDLKLHLISLKEEINNLKKEEISLIDRAYMVGYTEKEMNRKMKINYYKETHEPFVFNFKK